MVIFAGGTKGLPFLKKLTFDNYYRKSAKMNCKISPYLQLLGTGAADYKDIKKCKNKNCKEAVKLGGRNIRSASSLFIYPNCIIDFSAEAPKQIQRFNIEPECIRYILITHPHFDHFHPHSIVKIAKEKAKREYLHIYGNSWVVKLLKMEKKGETNRTRAQLFKPLKEYRVGKLTVMPIKANHSTDPNECLPAEMRYPIDEDNFKKSKEGVWTALNYIIGIKDKVILYAVDTGLPLEKTYQVYKKFKFDIVIYEATFQEREAQMHMNFPKIIRLKERMMKDKIISKRTCFIITHLSLHHTPVYSKIKDIFLKDGIVVSYDGMVIPV